MEIYLIGGQRFRSGRDVSLEQIEIWDPRVKSQGIDKVRMGGKKEKKMVIDKTLVIANSVGTDRRRLIWRI